ncbi:MAG: hypothetical protein DME23_15010 [Verrucomicrobia bacterium]|nr:MAG: hypothetical protein DME23_15010 [Verrucomicrobiota bacterium]
MTNDEIRVTKEFRKPNDEGGAGKRAGTSWTFVLRNSFDIRHSDFVIFQSHDSNAECGMRSAESNN